MGLPLHPQQEVAEIQIGALVGDSLGQHIVTFSGDNSQACTERSLEDLCALQPELSPMVALVSPLEQEILYQQRSAPKVF